MPFAARQGISIYFEQHGAGEPVVLVMGLGVDAHGWELQVVPFAERHHVVVLDNRGIGRSSKPAGPYTIVELAEDVRAVLDHARVGRTHVVGLSMGGMIAQELALRHPERVGALVLAVTYARPGQEVQATTQQGSATLTGGISPLDLLGGGAVDLRQFDPEMVFKFLMPLTFTQPFMQAKREWLREFMQRSLSYGFSPEAFLGQVAAVLGHDTVARLGSLACPTLVITGSADRLVPPLHGEELARLIPGARLETIEGAPHGLNFENPERFNRLVLDFLAQHPL